MASPLSACRLVPAVVAMAALTAACGGTGTDAIVTGNVSVDQDLPDTSGHSSGATVGSLGEGAKVTIVCRASVVTETTHPAEPLFGVFNSSVERHTLSYMKVETSVGTGYVYEGDVQITAKHDDGGAIQASEISGC